MGGGRGGNRAHQKKDFGTIPYFLEIADYKKAFMYAALSKSVFKKQANRLKTLLKVFGNSKHF